MKDIDIWGSYIELDKVKDKEKNSRIHMKRLKLVLKLKLNMEGIRLWQSTLG